MSAVTIPDTPPKTSHTKRNLAIAVAAVMIIAIVAAGGYGLWYLFLRPAGPAAVTAQAPVLPTDSVPAPASLDGTWTVNTSLGSMSDFSASWAGYRVVEQLVGVGGNTAVGRTPLVSGSLTLNGSVVSNVQITADLTGLASDNPNRDNQLRRQATETDKFPKASFVLSSPIDLGRLPADGQAVSATAQGSFTLHGVTRSVSIELQAVRRGGIIAAAGSLPVVFAEYGFQGPSSFAVLSVEDHGIMEFHVLFTHS
jgi:polyisoprenoid-binding protein YceI